METTYRRVKSREEIEAWLIEHDWQEHQGTYINPYSVGVFNRDMFGLCNTLLPMVRMSRQYFANSYKYMDTLNAYGWFEVWLEPEDCEIQQ